MALGAPPTAYDRATTIFSPEGDLYQVKYAFEAVRKGWTSLGIRSKEAVVIAAEKRQITRLLDLESIEKIYLVDDHIGVAFAGMGSDGRILIDQARLVAVRHRLLYGEKASVDYVARAIADIKQAYTQHAGVRPFGVSLIFGGINPEGDTRLIKTDPGGQFFSYYAVAIGMGERYATEVLEKEYNKELDFEGLVKLALKALFKARIETGEEQPAALVDEFHNFVELGYITVEKPVFRKMSADEIRKYVDAISNELTK
ncbi:MAG: archaeal proteasome endopeptidase complex subunit alpha [Desulfurococcales archaeon]|nr:archaeal proteasome endopeptidase complex subunit alpha [Desulfurococcales archaeon]MEB3765699.1 archaeal proteasome endopeptidase complex subunit alpha [Desulfurococcales archaeon]